MIDNKKIIQERIKEILSITQKNQKELAEMCGVSTNDISKAVNKGELSVNKAIQISNSTGFTLDYIFGNNECKNAQQYAQQQVIAFINKHIIFNSTKPTKTNPRFTQAINISEPLITYIEAVCEINNSTFIPDNSRDNLLQEIRNTFLKTIENNADFDMREIEIV